MKTISLASAKSQIKNGKFECLSDLKVGYVEIRRASGKRETVEITA